MLEKLMFEVVAVDNGKQAEIMYLKSPKEYFCLLLDFEMPIQTGGTTTKNIRKFDLLIPIIILTAHSTEKDREECLECGANEFLTKPVTLKGLQNAIEKCTG